MATIAGDTNNNSNDIAAGVNSGSIVLTPSTLKKKKKKIKTFKEFKEDLQAIKEYDESISESWIPLSDVDKHKVAAIFGISHSKTKKSISLFKKLLDDYKKGKWSFGVKRPFDVVRDALDIESSKVLYFDLEKAGFKKNDILMGNLRKSQVY